MADAAASDTIASFVLPSTANIPFSSHDLIYEIYKADDNDATTITLYSLENSSGTSGTDTLKAITYIAGVWFANDEDADQQPQVAITDDEAPRDKAVITFDSGSDDGWILVVGQAVR